MNMAAVSRWNDLRELLRPSRISLRSNFVGQGMTGGSLLKKNCKSDTRERRVEQMVLARLIIRRTVGVCNPSFVARQIATFEAGCLGRGRFKNESAEPGLGGTFSQLLYGTKALIQRARALYPESAERVAALS
ncbi:hypothetical protein GCM10022270_23940 [Terriglobus aquaticus]